MFLFIYYLVVINQNTKGKNMYVIEQPKVKYEVPVIRVSVTDNRGETIIGESYPIGATVECNIIFSTIRRLYLYLFDFTLLPEDTTSDIIDKVSTKVKSDLPYNCEYTVTTEVFWSKTTVPTEFVEVLSKYAVGTEEKKYNNTVDIPNKLPIHFSYPVAETASIPTISVKVIKDNGGVDVDKFELVGIGVYPIFKDYYGHILPCFNQWIIPNNALEEIVEIISYYTAYRYGYKAEVMIEFHETSVSKEFNEIWSRYELSKEPPVPKLPKEETDKLLEVFKDLFS